MSLSVDSQALTTTNAPMQENTCVMYSATFDFAIKTNLGKKSRTVLVLGWKQRSGPLALSRRGNIGCSSKDVIANVESLNA